MCKKLIFLISFVLVLGLVNVASSIDWKGPGTEWDVGTNWVGGVVPGPEDTATISGAVVGPTIDCDVNVVHIDGPRGADQVITVTGGHIVVQNVWHFGSDGGGTGTIDISGSPIIEIYGDSGYGRGWFGTDEGSSTINISGDPDIYIDSGIRGADDAGTVYNFYMSGGDVNCNSYMIGDDGYGDFYLTGGKFICRGEFKIHGREAGFTNILIGGEGSPAELIIGGTFLSPADSEGSAWINLDNGYIECASWEAAGEDWILDINEGMLRIKNAPQFYPGTEIPYVDQVQSWIDNGQITGFNDTETPQVTTDGSDIVVTVYFTHFKAYEPSPGHNATDVCPEGLQLHWMQGVYVDDHNVYFGTNMSDVNESALPVEEDWGPNTYTPTGLELGKTYYWRIDTVKDSCDASPWEGAIWQFTTENGKAKDPSPEDEQRGALPDSILSWIPSCVAAGHKLYFDVNLPERIVLFDDDFESGAFDPNWTNSGWDIWDANDDPCWAEFGEHDHNLARATGVGVKTLTSTNIDTSDYANTITVDFYVRSTEALDADELQLKYYNGSTYNTVNDFNVVELDPNGRWVHFTDTITDSQYLIINFGVQLVANITSGTVYVDDVTVTNSWPVDPNWFETDLGANDNNYAPTLSQFTHYYWRIDTVYDGNLVQGDFWDFTTGFGGLIMYYKFNGSQGNNLPSPITDDSGNSIQFWKYVDTGSVKYGESSPVVADSTASADFDPNAGLYRPDTGENDPLRLDGWQYTIEMWVNPQNLDESLDIDDPGDDDPDLWLDEEWDLWLIGKFDSWKIGIEDPGENNSFRWEHGGNGESMFNDSAVVGEWVHIAAVYDRTNENDERMQFYHNGMLEETAGEEGLNPADNNYPVTIGYAQKDDVNVGRYFDGLIDEVRIHDVALTPCEFLLFPGPEWASCPNPSDGETEVDPCTVKLMWTPGQGAVSHDVYFSSDYDDVNGAGATAVETTYGPNSWTPPNTPGSGTVYYWRVDTYDNGGPPYEGVVWQFTTKYTIDDEHLILWYKFDETSGDDAIDASGYGHHGDVDEEDNWDPDGHYNGCLLFDDDQAVDVPSKVTKYIGSQISISVWLNGLSDQRIRDHVILDVSTGEAASYAMRVVVPDEDGDVYWRAGNDSNDALVWDTATPKGWRGDWHHLVFIKDEDAGTMSIYFDADLKKDKSGTLPTLSNLFYKPFKIGAYTSSSSDYEGFMDDLRVYDYAIPESKVIELFRGGELCLAWGPSPADGQMDVPGYADLIWRKGDYASSHEVYFGTNKTAVEDANTTYHPGVDHNTVDVNTYDPGPLTLDQRYYWRIDEVNDTNDKLSCRGDIWKFKVANYIVIDDFEDYESSADLWGSWIDGALNSTGAIIALQSTSPISTGDKSMQYKYYTNVDFGCGSYYAQIQTKNLDPNNWDVFDLRILSLWFHGTTGNDANVTEQMYVALEDNDGNYAEARYPIADMDDIRDEEWYEWKIFLSDFTNVNRAKLKTLFIGFGDRDNTTTAGGMGEVHFDDIRVYPPHCVPEEGPEADLSGNCVVDFADIEIMADEWLDSDVNLGEVVKPDANGLVGWWKFDEAAADTNIATDYSDYDNNGVIETLNANVWWVAAGHDGNALEFDGGVVEIADDGNTPELRPIRKVSVMAWINRAHSVDNEEKVVVKGHDNWETYALEVSDENRARFLVRDANDRENQYTIDSPDELPVNSWVHVAGTYDGNELTVYVNGQVAANSVHPLWEKLATDANDGFAIAGRWGDTGGRFIGTIDDVRVYNYGLPPEEVAYIATDGKKIFAVQSVANLYNKEKLGEGAVNLRDFAELAKSWLEKKLWPE